MQRLYVLRHAKAEAWESGAMDHARALTRRGVDDATRMGAHVAREWGAPDLVLCSTAQRTRETLAAFEAGLGSELTTRFEDDLYNAPRDVLLEAIQTVGDDVGSILLIGHNPGIHGLAATLASMGTELDRVRAKMPTAALAVFEFDGAWSALRPAAARLTTFTTASEL